MEGLALKFVTMEFGQNGLFDLVAIDNAPPRPLSDPLREGKWMNHQEWPFWTCTQVLLHAHVLYIIMHAHNILQTSLFHSYHMLNCHSAQFDAHPLFIYLSAFQKYFAQ